MHDEQDNVRSFILRLWRERAATQERPAVWRLNLTDTSTGERRGFGCLQDLVHHLTLLMDPPSLPQRKKSPWDEP